LKKENEKKSNEMSFVYCRDLFWACSKPKPDLLRSFLMYIEVWLQINLRRLPLTMFGVILFLGSLKSKPDSLRSFRVFYWNQRSNKFDP